MGGGRNGLGAALRRLGLGSGYVWDCGDLGDGIGPLLRPCSFWATFYGYDVDSSFCAAPVWHWGVVGGDLGDDGGGAVRSDSSGNTAGDAVPTVVYGYFALLTLTPILQKIYPDLPQFSMLSAGLIMGIMIIPYVTSLGEDSMRSVPMLLREGAFALGDGKLGVALRVVFPGAFSGLASAYVLAISRAVGETMIVAIAAGLQPRFTLNPLESAATVTAFIVQVSLGDLPHGSVGYQSIFAAGAMLFLMTLGFNLAGHALRRRFHRAC